MLHVNLRHSCDEHEVDFYNYDELKEDLDVVLFDWREWVLITEQSHYEERHDSDEKDWVHGLIFKEECSEDHNYEAKLIKNGIEESPTSSNPIIKCFVDVPTSLFIFLLV